MDLPDPDGRSYYERRQEDFRPSARRPGENRAQHRERLRRERREKRRATSKERT